MQRCTHIVYSAMQYIYSLQCNAVDIYSAMCVPPFNAAYAQCRCGVTRQHGVVVHMSHDLDADDHELQDEGLFLSFSSNNLICAPHPKRLLRRGGCDQIRLPCQSCKI